MELQHGSPHCMNTQGSPKCTKGGHIYDRQGFQPYPTHASGQEPPFLRSLEKTLDVSAADRDRPPLRMEKKGNSSPTASQ
eukprot:scaffold1065_cov335-Pinguiococcus_pyrenoidosus.AAC.4